MCFVVISRFVSDGASGIEHSCQHFSCTLCPHAPHAAGICPNIVSGIYSFLLSNICPADGGGDGDEIRHFEATPKLLETYFLKRLRDKSEGRQAYSTEFDRVCGQPWRIPANIGPIVAKIGRSGGRVLHSCSTECFPSQEWV